MGAKTSIGWTEIIPGVPGATWNPIRARNKETHKLGWACVKVSEGCKFCYAEHQNMTAKHGLGTGLAYTVPNLEKIQMELSIDEGQTGIDWPLRAKKSQGIFPCSMTDWLGAEFVPVEWSNTMLTVMLLAQHHIFMTLTKRWDRLEKMLTYFTTQSKGAEAPNLKVFDLAILKAQGNYIRNWKGGLRNLVIRNAKVSAFIPWPPPNIFFGISVCTAKEAEKAMFVMASIKELDPGIKTWISYEPALDVIDWVGTDYAGNPDWLVVGGESGAGARRMPEKAVTNSIAFGKEEGIPVFVKQLGAVVGKELGLDSHGINFKDDMEIEGQKISVRQFPDVSKSYIPWK